MIKHTLTAVALATVLATPAFAQSTTPSTTPMTGATQTMHKSKAGFVQSQTANEWRSSKLVGTSVYGPDNQSIGEISDLILDGNGHIKAAVVGVGGFLGVGQKDVAVPFDAMNVTRKPNSATIDKITVSYTKDELKAAPKFAYYDPSGSGSSQTTGSSTSTPSTGGTMSK